MSTLHDRLVDLAADAPASAPDPLLWDRARAFHRRRRVGAAGALVVAVLAVMALVGLDAWQRAPRIEPAAPGAEPALPTKVWEPSGWLPGNDGRPTGPLALLHQAERHGWTGSRWGTVGVSATTGEYLFLDLPDDAHQGSALSPDGSRVAYWLTGETRRSPYTAGGQYLPAVGVAVWDARTGEVRRHEVDSDHGLSPMELVWADSDALVVSWATYLAGDDDPARRQGGALDRVGLRVWDLAADDGPVALGLDRVVEAGNGAGQMLTGDRRRPVVDVRTLERGGPSGRLSSYSGVTALSPDGTAVAYPRGSKNPGPLVVQREGGEPRRLVEERVWAALAWVDDDTVAFVTREVREYPLTAAIETVSVSTGERAVLVDTSGFQPSPGSVATDLLGVEPRDRPAPQTPWDPRVVTGLVLLVVVLAGLWVWGWRRRVEP